MQEDLRPKLIVEFGSNSLKIMQILQTEEEPRLDYREPLRLAAHILPSGEIAEPAIQQMIFQLQKLHHLYGENSEIRVFGTQALRQASNRLQIVRRIKKETAFDLNILSPAQEAQAAFRGIQSGMQLLGRVLCFDIGGGSTEIMNGSDQGLLKSLSFPLGAVSLSREFHKHDPIRICEYNYMNAEISRLLKLKAPRTKVALIGTGGSAVTCAMVALGLPQIEESKVNSFRLRDSELMRQIQTYRAMKIPDIAKIPGMDPARADIILAACLIMQRLMEIYGQEEIIVSSRGVRHGLVGVKV